MLRTKVERPRQGHTVEVQLASCEETSLTPSRRRILAGWANRIVHLGARRVCEPRFRTDVTLGVVDEASPVRTNGSNPGVARSVTCPSSLCEDVLDRVFK